MSAPVKARPYFWRQRSGEAKVNTDRGVMFKKSKIASAEEADSDESSQGAQLAREEADLRYDQDEDEDSGEGSTEETARYISDMVGALAAMASDARLDLLTYLLNMARVEAELQSRQSESPDEDF
jgi:hypothetical protein